MSRVDAELASNYTKLKHRFTDAFLPLCFLNGQSVLSHGDGLYLELTATFRLEDEIADSRCTFSLWTFVVI